MSLRDRVLAQPNQTAGKYYTGWIGALVIDGWLGAKGSIGVRFDHDIIDQPFVGAGFSGALPLTPAVGLTVGLLVMAQYPNQPYYEQASVVSPGGGSQWIVKFSDGTLDTQYQNALVNVCTISHEAPPELVNCTSAAAGSCAPFTLNDKVLVAQELGPVYQGCYKVDNCLGGRCFDVAVCVDGMKPINQPNSSYNSSGSCDGTGGLGDWYGAPSTGSWMSNEVCIQMCAPFNYAATEGGYQCFCGNTIRGVKTDDARCNITCTGDAVQTCGGPFGDVAVEPDTSQNSVYTTSAYSLHGASAVTRAVDRWWPAQMTGLAVSNALFVKGPHPGVFGWVYVGLGHEFATTSPYAGHNLRGVVKDEKFTMPPAVGMSVLSHIPGFYDRTGFGLGRVLSRNASHVNVSIDKAGVSGPTTLRSLTFDMALADTRPLCYNP